MKLYGKNPVIERLKSNPKTIRRIMIDEDHVDLVYIRKKCNQHGIGVQTVPDSQKIQRLAQNLNTQGILADIDDFVYMAIDELLDKALEKRRTPVFLDNLNDPQNLGGIIRSCGALGIFDIVLPTTESVSVTESVLRVACGGENYLSVARVSNLGNAIERAKKMGFWMMGTVVEEAQSLTETTLQFPLGLVMGSEEKGVRDIILKKLDAKVMIPMKNQRMSLNVAHATSMVCYEIVRQKKANPQVAALNFFAEAGLLKRVKRSGWWVAGIENPETVAEHCFRCAVIGYYIAHCEGVDPFKVVTMTLFNDIHEARINDLHKMGHYYIDFREAEKKAFADQIAFLDKRVKTALQAMREDYEGQKSRSSVVARDADILECLIQAKEYVDNGYPVAKTFFKRAPDHLKTATARKLWQQALSWDSHTWWQNVVKFER